MNGQGPDRVEALTAIVALLVTGQIDRRATDDPAVPLHVDQATAETSLPLAITLVEWFRSGVVLYNPKAQKR